MPFTGTTRTLVAAGAALGVLAVLGSTVAWRAGSVAGASPRPVVAAADVAPVPEPPVTTSSSSTTSSTTSSTSTSTTSPPTTAPPTTVTPPTAKPRSTAPPTVPRATAPAPPPTAWVPPVAQPTGTPAERCASAQQWVAGKGLPLPAGWVLRCPAPAVVNGVPRWGVACWNCEGAGNWIAVDVARIGPSEATLRHVIAHETCHAIDYMTLGITTEVGADLCAALHGAPRP